MSNNNNTVNDDDQIVSKDERIKIFVESMAAVEEAIEPFKEQLKELRLTFKENGWLSDDEIKQATTAYRLLKKGTDWENLSEMYKKVGKAKLRGNSSDMFIQDEKEETSDQ
jgi:uncharacterized protein YbcC (UPF0753/DUF2309 family)